MSRPLIEGVSGTAFPVDANLGVEGLPQSGTGQYSLLTGLNGAQQIGRHFGPWTHTALRPSLIKANLFRTLLDAGFSVAFANAYPKEYTKSRWFRRPAPVPLAASSAGVLQRDFGSLVDGRGVASDILNERIREIFGIRLPRVTGAAAGATLADIAAAYDFTFFAHYATDTVGHDDDLGRSRRALELVDEFLGGILEHRPFDVGLLVASDHGNIEARGGGHTRNPALGLWFPPPAAGATREGSAVSPPAVLPESLLDVADFVRARLSHPPLETPSA